MCGIWAIVGAEYQPSYHQKEFMKIAGRGPDRTVVTRIGPRVWLGFHRLAIVQPGDVPSSQPIMADGLSVVCNGEIYNHLDLKEQSSLNNSLFRNGGSDCAAILHAFRSASNDLRACCSALDGVFAFMMADREHLYVGRDPIGVRPLFYGTTRKGIVFGSEVKSIEKLCQHVFVFPPGCCARFPINSFTKRTYSDDERKLAHFLEIQRYHNIPIMTISEPVNEFDSQLLIRGLLIEAVEKRLMGNRQFGFMLSGGLDSSLIAAIATRFVRELSVNGMPTAFSVGFADSPDLEKARKVAKFLQIPLHVKVITPEQCIKIIPSVIYALETFDPLVVRCGVPHFLLCEYIAKNSQVKVLLSGEGADELFGSYTYMQRAPSAEALHGELVRRLKLLHQYDVLRCDRCTSCHGLEIRVPFLDKRFVDFVARLPPSFKLAPRRIEKHLLRIAFQGWLPDDVLWRSKEGFSEALGEVDFGDVLEQHASTLISDEQFKLRARAFPWKTPETKEEFWYRTLFEELFSLHKVDETLHTKVYKTASWQVQSKEQQIAYPEKLKLVSNDKERTPQNDMIKKKFNDGMISDRFKVKENGLYNGEIINEFAPLSKMLPIVEKVENDDVELLNEKENIKSVASFGKNGVIEANAWGNNPAQNRNLLYVPVATNSGGGETLHHFRRRSTGST